MRVSTTIVEVPWLEPLHSAHSAHSPTVSPRSLVLVRLTGADGVSGCGEAAPLRSYDGVTVMQVMTALRSYAPILARSDGDDLVQTLAACRDRVDLPQALAAIDLALWDLAGRRAGEPVWRLLGAPSPPAVRVNAVIGAVDPPDAAAWARAARRRGLGCVKVKIGVGDDDARVAAVRHALGPDGLLRVDANGAFADVDSAVAALSGLTRWDLELCEEPVHGARALAEVAARTVVPIAADESAGDPDLSTSTGVAAVCLKIASAGGICGILDRASRARALGCEVFLASTLDGPLGIAAALHAAAVLAPDRHCGLSTLERFDRPVPAALAMRGECLTAPPGAGLGDGIADWYG